MTKTDLVDNRRTSTGYSKPRLTPVGPVEYLTSGPGPHRKEENAYHAK